MQLVACLLQMGQLWLNSCVLQWSKYKLGGPSLYSHICEFVSICYGIFLQVYVVVQALSSSTIPLLFSDAQAGPHCGSAPPHMLVCLFLDVHVSGRSALEEKCM